MSAKIFIVTGANKGIGFHIAEGLLKSGSNVVLACRSESLGHAAAESLSKNAPSAKIDVVRFDLADLSTVASAAKTLKDKFPDGLDGVVNNAGMAYANDSTVPFGEQAETTVNINYFGAVAACEAFLPLVKEGGRIINISSSLGTLQSVDNAELRERWVKATSKAAVDDLITEFVSLAKEEKHGGKGWPTSGYSMSKLALTTYTRVLGAANPKIHVYACCPGWCKTSLTGNQGYKTAEEGADTPVWTALSEEVLKQIPQGELISERKHLHQV